MKVLYCNTDLIRHHIAEALVMGGLPMSTTTESLNDDIEAVTRVVFGVTMAAEAEVWNRLQDHLDRGPKLGKAKPGSGHDCFLKGVVVTAVVTAPAYQWPQIQRYHFLDITSSQSKMHKITKMDIKAQCNDEVDDVVIDNLNKYIGQYNDVMAKIADIKASWRADTPANAQEKHDAIKAQETEAHRLFRKIVNNAPQGLHLAAGIVTNYLQLKTMKLQRQTHKLEEWSDTFVEWVDSLPYFNEFTGA